MKLESLIQQKNHPLSFIKENLQLSFQKGASQTDRATVEQIDLTLRKSNIRTGATVIEDPFFISIDLIVTEGEISGLVERIQGVLQQQQIESPGFRLSLLIKEQECESFSFNDGQVSKLFSNMNDLRISMLNFNNVYFNSAQLFANQLDKLELLIFNNCRFDDCTVRIKDSLVENKIKFHSTEFQRLVLQGTGLFAAPQSRIAWLDSECSGVAFSNIKAINLFSQVNLESVSLDFENVGFKFNLEPIRKFCDKENMNGFLNSFSYIERLKGLQSELLEIERYSNYFRAKNHWFTMCLYWLNGGYHRILRPTLILFGSLCLIKIQIDFFKLYSHSDSMALVFDPKKMLEQVVLKNFNFNPLNIYWPKVLIGLLLIISVYTLFSLLTAIKRRFGFPRSK